MRIEQLDSTWVMQKHSVDNVDKAFVQNILFCAHVTVLAQHPQSRKNSFAYSKQILPNFWWEVLLGKVLLSQEFYKRTLSGCIKRTALGLLSFSLGNCPCDFLRSRVNRNHATLGKLFCHDLRQVRLQRDCTFTSREK